MNIIKSIPNTNIVLMRYNTDCEVAALATVTSTDYETARKAVGWKKLALSLENPMYGNPYNVYLAIIRLKHWKRNITFQDILMRHYTPLKTVILLHDKDNPYLNQHYAVLGDTIYDKVEIFMGDSNVPILLDHNTLQKRFTDGFPNVAFEVYPCNIFKRIFNKFKLNIKHFISKLF